ncbi:hypothetical protein [Spiroplasma diminutum]|uniref:MOLPALP family lipoprotein n=1 Tax=Spiroplasma diminutum CUAS-1 TaxID=1276221 RepID=S5LW47_9MOLU|nr:hypothetical protein [Spiroplasma diminutum]AGR42024.1 hypothetical protein SDIMI_v3c03200 [Spiroplasma diminutum CUAS-1]
MKKLIILLGAISIGTSTLSVASCSMVNSTKQSVKNKVDNLVKISSTLMRGTVIQNASQNLKNQFAYDSNFLNTLISNSKANDLLPSFKTDNQTTLKQLNDSYFNNQDLSRSKINEKNENFLTENVKKPTSSTDEFSSTFVVAASAIKSNGGIHPSISGLLQGILPSLNLSDDLIESLSSQNLMSIAQMIEKISKPLSHTLAALQESNAFYAVLKNFFNSDFENSVKEKNNTNIFKWVNQFLEEIDLSGFADIFDNLINSILSQDMQSEQLTGEMILNASLNKISNIFARMSEQSNKIVDKNKIYSLDKNFDKTLGSIIGEFFKKLNPNLNDFNINSLLNLFIKEPENIVDLLFVISSLLKHISSVDFSIFTPENDEYLFDNNKNNNQFLEENAKLTLKQNPYSTKRILKNLSTITNAKEDFKGKQLQKMFYLLFNSGEKVTNIEENITSFSLISKLSSIPLLQNKKNNYSSVLYGLGNGLAVWQGWSFAGIGPDQVGNALRWVLGDGLGFNSDFSGLNKVLDILKGFGVEINFKVSASSTQHLKHLFSALWDEDSTLLKDITGKQISLYSLFTNEIVTGMTISDIFDLVYKNIESNESNKRNTKSNITERKAEKLANGLDILSKALINENYELWFKKGNKFNKFEEHSNNGKYTALQTMIIASKKGGLYLKINDSAINENIKGAKAAMYALGTDYDSDGNQINSSFRSDSFLEALESIVDDPITNNILDDLLNGFSDIRKINDNISNTIYKKLIKDNNFTTKKINYENIDNNNLDQSIKYQIIYKDPFQNKIFEYEVNLLLKVNETSWQINTIKRI